MPIFQIQKEGLYILSGSGKRTRRFQYVAELAGTQIAVAATKEEAERLAAETLLDAFKCQTSSIYASVACDGHVVTTREYAPGFVETGHHRKEDGRSGGICMSGCSI